MNSPVGQLISAKVLALSQRRNGDSSARFWPATFPPAELPGSGRHLEREEVSMETVFVAGRRTRSRCQATGAAAPVAASASAEAGLRQQRPARGCWGAPAPQGAAGATAAPPATPPEAQWGDGAVLPSPPAAPEELFRPASSSASSQRCSAGRALAVRSQGRKHLAAVCKVVLRGPRWGSADPRALPQRLSSSILQPALYSFPFSPFHPLAQPRCRAGTTWVVPSLTKFSL